MIGDLDNWHCPRAWLFGRARDPRRQQLTDRLDAVVEAVRRDRLGRDAAGRRIERVALTILGGLKISGKDSCRQSPNSSGQSCRCSR